MNIKNKTIHMNIFFIVVLLIIVFCVCSDKVEKFSGKNLMVDVIKQDVLVVSRADVK